MILLFDTLVVAVFMVISFTPVIITEKITDSTPGIIKQTTESTNKTENVSANQNDDLDITIETVTTKVSTGHDEDLFKVKTLSAISNILID
jgi:hypothetical protein